MSGKGPQGRWIEWVDGKPVARYTEPVTKQTVSEMLPNALSLPYVQKRIKVESVVDGVSTWEDSLAPDEELFEGMTMAQAMAYRRVLDAARGGERSLPNAMHILDRVVGKVVNKTEVVTTTLTYQNLLDHFSELNASDPVPEIAVADIRIIDVRELSEEDLLDGV